MRGRLTAGRDVLNVFMLVRIQPPQIGMTNGESQMTNEWRSTNVECRAAAWFRHSVFNIPSTFVIRISSFPPRSRGPTATTLGPHPGNDGSTPSGTTVAMKPVPRKQDRMRDDKRLLRRLKRDTKRVGNRKRRRYLKDVNADPKNFDFGRNRSDVMNTPRVERGSSYGNSHRSE
jgi:hypothetical protein